MKILKILKSQTKIVKLAAIIACVVLVAVVGLVLAHTFKNKDVETEHEHTYTWHDEVEPTCTSDGTQGYYSCEECGMLFDQDKNEVTLESLTIKGGHIFEDLVCTRCGMDLNELVEAIETLPEDGYTFTDIETINALKVQYDTLDDDVKKEITNKEKLEEAVAAIEGIEIVAGADMIMSGKQCDQSLSGFNTEITDVTGIGEVAIVHYDEWQWANFIYGSEDKIEVGTNVAFGIYNASEEVVDMHWGNANTIYTDSSLATLQPGWNLVSFTWEWDKNVDNGDYLISSHLYALSPVGSDKDMNGWKFTGLFTYTDEEMFETIYTNSVTKSGEKFSSLSTPEGVSELISALPNGNFTFADVVNINAAKEAYDGLSENAQKKVTNVEKLEQALSAISGIELVAEAAALGNGGQCDDSIVGFGTSVTEVAGLGETAKISYNAWQWANYRYDSTEKIEVGTKVAFGIYNASEEAVDMHWGNASTIYTETSLAKLQPGWNLVSFTWEWDKNVDGGDYLISSHLYALSPVGSDKDMNGWKFTGLFTYTDAELFETIYTNSVAKSGEEASSLSSPEGVSELISLLPNENFTLADVANINAAKEAYDGLSDNAKKKVTNAAKLNEALSAISGIELIAEAGTLGSGGQCDDSLAGFEAIVTDIAGLGKTAKISYNQWQWANYRYDSSEKLQVGTKVAFGIYNASEEVVGMHWGNASTIYTESNLVKLQPGWNLVSFTWEWDKNVDGGDYPISAHLYALSPAGSDRDMNGWKFTGLFTYTDEELFETIYTNSVTKSGEKVSDLSSHQGIIEMISALPSKKFTLADVANINAAKEAYDGLSDNAKKKVTNVAKLDKALSAISGIELVAEASTVKSGGQCDESLKGFKTTIKNVAGLGKTAKISYNKWQWANYHYDSSEKLEVGTKVAFGIYNASEEVVGMHWGNASTIYTESNLVKLQPGWNLVSFAWEWDKNVDDGDYLISSHLYALSPAGSDKDMNGWKFTGLFTYTDEELFETIYTNSVTKSGEEASSLSSYKGVNKMISALPSKNFTLADVANINAAKEAYDGLSDTAKKKVTNVKKLKKALSAISGVQLVAESSTVKSGGQCDESLKGFKTTIKNTAGLGKTAKISYKKWQWANYRYDSSEKLKVGTKVAFGIYNASDEVVDMHWGNASTIYTESNLVKLQPGWNLVSFKWEWDKNVDNGDYLVSSHLYALSPAGSDKDMNGWKFTGLFTYTDEELFETIYTNSVTKSGEEFSDLSSHKGVSALISALPDKNFTLEDVANINAAKEAYDGLSDSAKKKVTNVAKLNKALSAISGIELIAESSTVKSGGQCDDSLEGFKTTSENVAGLGKAVKISYNKWQWANYCYGSAEKIAVGTKAALGVYNPTAAEVKMHWGNASTIYTEKDLVTLKPGWNIVTYTWTWDKNSDGGDYPISSHLYALSPVGSGTDMNGWKFTGLFTYTDDSVFKTISANTITKLGGTGNACIAAEHVHKYVWNAKVEATCTKDGREGYYTCEGCEKIFNADKKEVTLASLTIAGGHKFVNGVCTGCGLNVEGIMAGIDNLSLATISEVLAQYNALSDADKELITNADKLTPYRSMKIISASELANFTENGSVVSFTEGFDETYGAYSELIHTSGWAAVHYDSTMVLAGNKSLVVYMYNPTDTDVDIAFGYVNDSHTETVFGNQCYTYATLKAGAWTKVEIKWKDAYGEMELQYMLMIASNLASTPNCTAGSGVNLSGFKMSSMYIMENADILDDLIQGSDEGDQKSEVEEVIAEIAKLSLATTESELANVREQYDALSEEEKAQVTNVAKLTAYERAYESMTVISADTLANEGENGSAVTFTNGTDATYGKYGELTHTAGWASVKYASDMQLQNQEKDLVVYVYNPTAADVDIAFGYLNGSHTESIFGNACYKYATLKAGVWTKVVIDWSAYKEGNVQVQHILMIASTGGSCTAGNTVNLTGFKMSSMYIVDDATTLDALIQDSDSNEGAQESAVDKVNAEIAKLSLATTESELANVREQYDALSEEEKAQVTNVAKLTAYESMTVISADTLANWGDCGSAVTFTGGTDTKYGKYGELNHTASWAAVKYASDMQLQNVDKDLVVYVYNPTEADVDIAFGYVNDSHAESIFKNECYKYATLKAGAWTKVVIDWSAYKAGDVQVQHILMIASTGDACTAGNGVNLTGFKMSSMYIVDEAAILDTLIQE